MGLPDKRTPTTNISSIRKKTFPLRTIANALTNILRILQLILFRNFLTLLENVEYLQCTSTTKDLTYVKKKLKFKKKSSGSVVIRQTKFYNKIKCPKIDCNMASRISISDENLNFIGNQQPKFDETERKF